MSDPAGSPDPGGSELELVLVSGMSGAGRSTAARALEDLGWFVIDNLPPALLPSTVELGTGRAGLSRVAVVVDVRGGDLFGELQAARTELHARGLVPRILFLEASDESLVRRFESSRRPHPLQGDRRVLDGIEEERDVLRDLRGDADLVIDTSALNVHQLTAKVAAAFGDADDVALRATVVSFGYKYGIPVDADLVVDVRFLPNPYWVPELRDHNGLDQAVNDYVVDQPGAREFLDRYAELLHLIAGGYLREGKRYVTVAVGCTGGKHRSVAMSEHLAARFVREGVDSVVVHRDMGRE